MKDAMTSFPENDGQFEEVRLKAVTSEGDGKGWSADREDGWSFWIPQQCPVEPRGGMTVRLYGPGIGAPFRGLFVDGHKVFYRTEAEDKEHREIEAYGADASDWLARWDAGRTVWSIEMGGLGPGYEQAIQITVAEILRHLLAIKYDASLWKDADVWKANRDAVDRAVLPVVSELGLSGAQWGAAMSLATKLYRDGPRGVMLVPDIEDRHIQVSRETPSLERPDFTLTALSQTPNPAAPISGAPASD